ncbi:MAG: tRNA pseudouridine(13) synthase TruD [Wenzhouxiangellaceae bacterium]|nr:tRNA pseudouridine(13) synthase TruD [Wenzhouxiangellaceae bacterium]
MTEFAFGGPVARGAIRTRPEDFRVVEDTGYTPSGEGEHLWLEIEKRGANTVDVARRLADLAGVSVRDVGFAGLKDRNAVTVQPFSIQLPGRADPDWQSWQDDQLRILSVARHSRKIQRGRLAGNRFELVVREIEGDQDGLEQRLQDVARHGVPNGFGEQRFGGNNIARAYRLFRGELRRKPSKSKRGFYLSAARSLVFNQVLERRIAQGNWNEMIDGDVLMLDGTHSVFAGDAADPEQQRRVAGMDLHPTGPMVGEGDCVVSGQALEIEREVIEQNRELVEGLCRFRLRADRRSLRMRVLDLKWAFESGSTLRLEFELRSGCYATTMLREVLEYSDRSHDTVAP